MRGVGWEVGGWEVRGVERGRRVGGEGWGGSGREVGGKRVGGEGWGGSGREVQCNNGRVGDERIQATEGTMDSSID